MSDKSLSEAKFALQDVLMEKAGLAASAHVDAIDKAGDKAALDAEVAKAIKALEAKKPEAAKALSVAWTQLRFKL